MCGRSWPLAFCSGSVCGSGPVVWFWPFCVVWFRPRVCFKKRGDDPGHRPRDRVFRPTDHVQSGLSVVVGHEGRRPEHRSSDSYTPTIYLAVGLAVELRITLYSLSFGRCGVTGTPLTAAVLTIYLAVGLLVCTGPFLSFSLFLLRLLRLQTSRRNWKRLLRQRLSERSSSTRPIWLHVNAGSFNVSVETCKPMPCKGCARQRKREFTMT